MSDKRRTPMLGALLACMMAPASCGTQTHDSVSAAVRSYVIALANDDGARACGKLTPAAQRQVVRTLAWTGSSTCAGALWTAYGHAPDSFRQRLLTVRVVDVHVHGNTATARVRRGDRTAELVQVDSQWRISGGVLPVNK